MSFPKETLDDTFDYHPPIEEETKKAHENVRVLCKRFLDVLANVLPDDRPRELAQIHTDVENVMFHANGAIARSAAQKRRVQEGLQAQADAL